MISCADCGIAFGIGILFGVFLALVIERILENSKRGELK
jgi:hypothetical protein